MNEDGQKNTYCKRVSHSNKCKYYSTTIDIIRSFLIWSNIIQNRFLKTSYKVAKCSLMLGQFF